MFARLKPSRYFGNRVTPSRCVSAVSAAVVALSITTHARAQRGHAELASALARAGTYVLDFQHQMAGVVAEESYLQEVRQGSRVVRPTTARPLRRRLKSDLLLVRPVGATRWIQFRDVFEVDGSPVRDRTDRLMKLFVEPSASLGFQLERITMESSRYNVGNIRRTINVPVMALAVLDPANQPGFRFELADTNTPGAWTIAFRETQSRTLIRTNGDANISSHGRVRIEPATGRVLMTEIVADDGGISATIDVEYQKHERLGLLVPSEMREHYVVASDWSTIDGTATYGNFRQFQVKVDEQMAPVGKKEQ